MEIFNSIAKRLIRNSLATVIAGTLSAINNDPKYLVIAPVINALAKWARTQFNWKWLPL